MDAPGRSAFGLALQGSLALPGAWAAATPRDLPLQVELAGPAAIDARFSSPTSEGWQGVSDGRRFAAVAGRAGDLLMTHGELTAWLAPDRTTLLVDGDLTAPTVLRPLLDSVLFTVGLWRGREALHAGAVLTEHGLVAVTGDSGSGKSSLIAALLEAGERFFADDVLVLDGDIGFPGPPFMTLPLDADPRGESLAELDGERWVACRCDARPARLAAVIALETTVRPSWATLLDALLRFPNDEAAQARRADLALRLAASVPVVRVVPRSAPPRELARRVLSGIILTAPD